MKNYKEIWKTLADTKSIRSDHLIQLAVVKAMNSKANVSKIDIVHALLQKYFSPVTNKTKLANGRTAYDTLVQNVRMLTYMSTRPDDVKVFNSTQFFDTPAEYAEYRKLLMSIDTTKLGKLYVYYFTTQDITPEQQGVQAGHALFLLGTQVRIPNPDKVYFQWIGVENSKKLEDVMRKHKALNAVPFYESDMDHKLTAVAYHPILWNKRNQFLEYSLLTH